MSLRARGSRVVLLLLVSLACLAGPATASAYVFTVNSTGDQTDAMPGDGICETAAATCTMRAAIEEANSSGESDVVRFDAIFDGTSGSVIELDSSLPTVSSPLVIRGDATGPCPVSTHINGPCVGIVGAAGEPDLVVDAAPALVSGLAISGGSIGIELEEHAGGAELHDNWIGFGLDQSPGANEIGILAGPGEAGAKIGGDTAAERNVVGNSTDAGIELRGASDAHVSGNFVGVAPDGESAASNGTGIEVDSVTPAGPNATGDMIGGSLTPDEAQSSYCDGPCNVISGSLGSGIDLTGHWPQTFVATGPTRIVANYVGLDAGGSRGIANAGTGIVVGAAPHVTIGAPEGASGALQLRDGNHLNGGAVGISAEVPTFEYGYLPNGVTIEGNSIGLDPSGNAMLAPPREFGILNEAQGAEEKEIAHIIGNRIAMSGGEAIRQRGGGAEIKENDIGAGADGTALPGAATGIHLDLSGTFASRVVGNVIADSAEYGLLIENSRNWVVGDRIMRAGVNGVRVHAPGAGGAVGNTIGENAPSSELTISESGGAAIALAPASIYEDTRIGQVRGGGNGGMFIDVGPVGPGSGSGIVPANEKNGVPSPYEPLGAPVLTRVTATSISGKGPAGEVHVYSKSDAAPGELGQQIDVALPERRPEPGSDWTIPLSVHLKNGEYVAVGTTIEGLGSSELRILKVDFRPPMTRIVRHPGRSTHRRSAKFGFRANEKGSTFECNLDHRHFRLCRSPVSYRHLRPGKHVFRVRGTDAAGNRAKASAHWKFRVLR